MKKHTFGFLQITLIIFIVSSAVFFSTIVVSQNEREQTAVLRELVSQQAGSIQSGLSNEINASLNLVLGLVGFINVVENPTHAEFERIAEVIIRESDIVRNVGLAPDNIISYMHPIEGNEAAIGLDFMNTPNQKDTVIRAIETRSTVIAGPLELVQGGMALIARVPIFTGMNQSTYWGIASIVVDKSRLFDKIRISSYEDWLEIAILGKDGKGLGGDPVYGDKSVFKHDPVMTTLTLPDGEWVIAAVPKNGWNSGRCICSYAVFWTSLAVALIISFLSINLMRSNRNMHFQALHDPLTKLANRRFLRIILERQLSVAKRAGFSFYVLYFDLDNFKAVNDFHGHKVGDAVLKQVAGVVGCGIRECDVLARVGGDEFVLLPCQVNQAGGIEVVCSKLLDAVDSINGSLKLEKKISCSIGVSSYPGDADSIDELIRTSDEAMYISKKRGKNCFSRYSEGELSR